MIENPYEIIREEIMRKHMFNMQDALNPLSEENPFKPDKIRKEINVKVSVKIEDIRDDELSDKKICLGCVSEVFQNVITAEENKVLELKEKCLLKKYSTIEKLFQKSDSIRPAFYPKTKDILAIYCGFLGWNDLDIDNDFTYKERQEKPELESKLYFKKLEHLIETLEKPKSDTQEEQGDLSGIEDIEIKPPKIGDIYVNQIEEEEDENTASIYLKIYKKSFLKETEDIKKVFRKNLSIAGAPYFLTKNIFNDLLRAEILDDYLRKALNFYFQEKEDLNIRSQKIAVISGLNLSFIKNYSKCKEDYLAQLIVRDDDDISIYATIGLVLGVLCNTNKESSILKNLAQMTKVKNIVIEMLNYITVGMRDNYFSDRKSMIDNFYNDHYKWFLPDIVDNYFSISIPLNDLRVCSFSNYFYTDRVIGIDDIAIERATKVAFVLDDNSASNNSKKSKGVRFYLEQIFTATLNENKLEDLGELFQKKIVSNIFNFTVELQKIINSTYFTGVLFYTGNKREEALMDLISDSLVTDRNKHVYIINCYNHLERFEEAIEYSLKNDNIKNEIGYYIHTAHAYFRKGDYIESIEYLEKTLEKKFNLKEDENYFYVLRTLGKSYYKIDNLSKSRTFFKKIIEYKRKDDDCFEALYYLGFISKKELKHGEAVTFFKEALRNSYKEKKCLYYLFECYLALNEYDNINVTIEELNKIDECLADFCKFMFYKKNEDYEKMWKVLDDLNSEKIEDTKILNDLGIFYNDEFGDSKTARNFFKKAHNLKPNEPAYIENIIQTYFTEINIIASDESFKLLEYIRVPLEELEKKDKKSDRFFLHKFNYHFFRSVYFNIDEFEVAKAYFKDKEMNMTGFGEIIKRKNPIDIARLEEMTVSALILKFKIGRSILPFYSQKTLKINGIDNIEIFSFTSLFLPVLGSFYNKEGEGFSHEELDENDMIYFLELMRSYNKDKSFIGFLYLLEISFLKNTLIEREKYIKENSKEVLFFLNNFPYEFSYKIIGGDIPYIDFNDNYLKIFKKKMNDSLFKILNK